MQRVPCDPHLRERLDPVSPQGLRPVLPSLLRQRQRGQALAALAFLEGPSLWAWEGTESCASQTRHGASGFQRGHRHGASTSAPQLRGAALLPPDRRAVMPLRPAAMMRHEGTAKKEGARPAAKRCMTPLRQDQPPPAVPQPRRPSQGDCPPPRDPVRTRSALAPRGAGRRAGLGVPAGRDRGTGRARHLVCTARPGGGARASRSRDQCQAPPGFASARPGQVCRVRGAGPGQGPTLPLAHGPAGAYTPCVGPPARWPGAVAARQ
jgi:hypothetical protein